MNNELVEKLKWIRSEVLALKQAHEYGLGRADFFYYEASIEVGEGIHNLLLEIKYPSLEFGMPYVWVMSVSFSKTSVEMDGINTVRFYATTPNYSGGTFTINVYVISSKQTMDGISLEEI